MDHVITTNHPLQKTFRTTWEKELLTATQKEVSFTNSSTLLPKYSRWWWQGNLEKHSSVWLARARQTTKKGVFQKKRKLIMRWPWSMHEQLLNLLSNAPRHSLLAAMLPYFVPGEMCHRSMFYCFTIKRTMTYCCLSSTKYCSNYSCPIAR